MPLPPIPLEPGPKPPLPPTAPGANIQIRRGYDPKAPKAAAPPVPSDKFLISPITGERVPAENMAEHMKISLLDPRWREQRDRVLQEKKEQEQVFAEGKTPLYNVSVVFSFTASRPVLFYIDKDKVVFMLVFRC